MRPLFLVVPVLIIVIGLVGLGWVKRPRLVMALVLAPFSLVGGAWRQVKRLWALPENVTKWLAYSVLEKDARSLRHHTEVGAALLAAGPDFRPAAREVLNRVLAGYGIRPADDSDEEQPPTNGDVFAQARVAAAAKAVTEAGKKAHTP